MLREARPALSAPTERLGSLGPNAMQGRWGTQMLTCRDMFSTLNIEPEALLPCCTAQCGFRLDYHGGPFPVAGYLRYLQLMQRRFRQQRPTCSPTCNRLAQVPDDSLTPFPTRLSFSQVLINHHRHYCNCRCTYCPFWNVKPKPPLFSIADILQSLMAQEVIADACTFAWGGGESTLLPEFDEQVILLAGRGYRQFIHTNAVRFSPAIAEVLRRGQAVVNVSLDSGDAAGYARIKGIDAWDQVIENLGRYRQQLVRPDALEIKYIINRDSAHPHAIQRFFDTCRRLDIKRVLYAFDITDRPWEPYYPLAEFFVRQAEDAGMEHDFFFG